MILILQHVRFRKLLIKMILTQLVHSISHCVSPSPPPSRPWGSFPPRASWAGWRTSRRSRTGRRTAPRTWTRPPGPQAPCTWTWCIVHTTCYTVHTTGILHMDHTQWCTPHTTCYMVHITCYTVHTRDDRSRTKIRRNFRFRPVLPGFGFVCPFFDRFCPFFSTGFARFCPFFAPFSPFLRENSCFLPIFARFAQFCPFCPVRSVLSKFTRIHSVSFVPCLPGFGHHWCTLQALQAPWTWTRLNGTILRRINRRVTVCSHITVVLGHFYCLNFLRNLAKLLLLMNKLDNFKLLLNLLCPISCLV